MSKRLRTAILIVAGALGIFATAHEALAEYGDVVINNYSDAAGIRPVVFPHWFHRMRFRCKVCHSDLGIKFAAGGNDINMLKIIDGQFCGACHNGSVAWAVENCELCHSGKPGTPTQVHESTLQRLKAPAAGK
ncbi:MAG TPA: c(7)-type cytochrome triheme domain-containing protein [Burkholderiales bacterium]